VPPERPSIGGRIRGKLDGDHRQDQREQVEKNVRRIGQQCKRIGPDAADYLRDQSKHCYCNGIFEAVRYALVEMHFGFHIFSLSSIEKSVQAEALFFYYYVEYMHLLKF
jgi:hypothetical protein